MHKDDIPDQLAFKEQYLAQVEGWLNPGGSVIVDPDGNVILQHYKLGALLPVRVLVVLPTEPTAQRAIRGHGQRAGGGAVAVQGRHESPTLDLVNPHRAIAVAGHHPPARHHQGGHLGRLAAQQPPELDIYPVGRAVNSPRNDSASLLEPETEGR